MRTSTKSLYASAEVGDPGCQACCLRPLSPLALRSALACRGSSCAIPAWAMAKFAMRGTLPWRLLTVGRLYRRWAWLGTMGTGRFSGESLLEWAGSCSHWSTCLHACLYLISVRVGGSCLFFRIESSQTSTGTGMARALHRGGCAIAI